MMLTLLRTELRLLYRDSTAFTTAVALPVVLGGLWALNEPPVGEGIAAMAVIQLMLMLAFTLHSVGVMILATRRESGVLRRWRISGASDTAVLVGTLGVPAGLAAAQALALTAATVWLWSAVPGRTDLVVLGTTVGVAVLLGWTVVAAAFTRSAEHSMITTFPVIMLIVVGTVFALTQPLASTNLAVLAIPVGPAIQLLRMGWETDAASASTIVSALVAGGLHALLAAIAALVTFRWSPSHLGSVPPIRTSAQDLMARAMRTL